MFFSFPICSICWWSRCKVSFIWEGGYLLGLIRCFGFLICSICWCRLCTKAKTTSSQSMWKTNKQNEWNSECSSYMTTCLNLIWKVLLVSPSIREADLYLGRSGISVFLSLFVFLSQLCRLSPMITCWTNGQLQCLAKMKCSHYVEDFSAPTWPNPILQVSRLRCWVSKWHKLFSNLSQ